MRCRRPRVTHFGRAARCRPWSIRGPGQRHDLFLARPPPPPVPPPPPPPFPPPPPLPLLLPARSTSVAFGKIAEAFVRPCGQNNGWSSPGTRKARIIAWVDGSSKYV